jgi:hypothetical protein
VTKGLRKSRGGKGLYQNASKQMIKAKRKFLFHLQLMHSLLHAQVAVRTSQQLNLFRPSFVGNVIA